VRELDDQLEYDHLKNYAWALGFHAEIHKHFDPAKARPGRESACWYLMRSKKQNPGVAPHELSILKFALASEVYDWLVEYRKTMESPT
jgi:hypothetical protein